MRDPPLCRGLRILRQISFLCNFAGNAIAISGNLSPIVAAILMPVSSISVVAIATRVSFSAW